MPKRDQSKSEVSDAAIEIDLNVEAVREKMLSRMQAGLRKYGVTTERQDLSRKQWLIHAQEEAMDLAVYLERLIREERDREDVQAMIMAEPNPECGCQACNPSSWWMVVCSICGNKRCPHADSHLNRCTGSNELGQVATVV